MLFEIAPGRKKISVSDSMLIAASNLTIAYTNLLAQREGREGKYPSEITTEVTSTFLDYVSLLHAVVSR